MKGTVVFPTCFPAIRLRSGIEFLWRTPYTFEVSFTSLVPTSLLSGISILVPAASPPVSLDFSFGSFDLRDSPARNLRPLGRGFAAMALFLTGELSSASLPSESFPLGPLGAPISSSSLRRTLSRSSSTTLSFSDFTVSSSVPQVISVSLLGISCSSSRGRSLLSSAMLTEGST